jgi:putative transposase
MPDHLHLAVSIPPKVAIADIVRRLKSASSLIVNRAEGEGEKGRFAWQAEYGVISLGERSLPDVVAYVRNQRAHHADRTVRSSYEETERPYPEAGLIGAARG